MLYDHTTIGGSLEILLYHVDSDLTLIAKRLDVLSDRITAHQPQEPPAGEAHTQERRQWQTVGQALEREGDNLMAMCQSLRAEKLALQREKRANNKDFVETMSKMGVTSGPPASKNGTPTASSTAMILQGGGFYVGMGEVEALQALERGNADISKYIRERKKVLSSKEIKSDIVKEPDIQSDIEK
jgi:hypothetical protein